MDNFEAALRISYEKWVDSIPDNPEPYEHSEKYKQEMQKLCDKMRNDKFHTFTKRTARTLLIAAILLLIATVAFASTVGRDFIIRHFDGFATYSITDTAGAKDIDELTLNYIPEGFELTDVQSSPLAIFQTYQNDSLWFNINKIDLIQNGTFDTIKRNEEQIIIAGITYVYYNDGYNSGLYWNNGNYTYLVNGNISKEELLKIAENIE